MRRMDGRWQVLALCGLTLLQLPISAQQAEESETEASIDDGQMTVATSMRGASTPARGFRPMSKPPPGAWLEETSSFGEDASTRRLYGLPNRDISNPEWFDCKTTSCGIHDKFYELTDNRTNSVHKNYQCKGALPAALSSFRTIAVEQCRAYSIEKLKWPDCRSMYCDMYEKIVRSVTNGTEYFLGGDCTQILSFNKSICLSYYRDSSSFCDCICPALHLLESTDACRDEIVAYLLFGRRGGKLLARFPMSGLCSTYFCKWIQEIADPRNPVKGAPPMCLNQLLPFQRSQCANLMFNVQLAPVLVPYDPCPWDEPSSKDFMLNCTDGTICDVRVDSWACCQRHAYRRRCPKNFPVMCANPLECVGETDHCCVEEAGNCASGVRGCSPLMDPNMPEWTGKVPPGVPAYIGPTTTMSMREFKMWLARQPKPTTEPESWGEDVMPYLWFIVIPVVVVLTCLAIIACYCFGHAVWKLFNDTLFGARRFMTLYQTDIVHLFRPDDKEREWPDLPPKISDADRQRMEADQAACQALKDACRIAFSYGRIHLVSVHFATGPGPQQQGRDIHAAVAGVRARGLQEEGEMPGLIEEGLRWADILLMETLCVEALERAFPSLTVDFNNLTTPPVPGAPWAATTVGHAVDCDKRREVWATIEELSQAIKVAEEGGASTGLTLSGHELMNKLIAKTPELPADRCVLDPSGKGIKLLPKGKQRGLWNHTGDTYLYDPDNPKSTGALNDFELPPGEELVGTSVASARPVCATFATTGTCKLGKRCPWRHCKPIKGDAIREPIGFA